MSLKQDRPVSFRYIKFNDLNKYHEGPISGSSASKYMYCLYKWANKYGNRGPPKQTWAYFLLIANYSLFILNQYQEVGQRSTHTVTPKKKTQLGHVL